jgi:hypothetical protein
MGKKFEYMVCQMQWSHITFMNGQWQGSIPPKKGQNLQQLLDVCPELWSYLNQAGQNGWELVSTLPLPGRQNPGEAAQLLFLKREIS